MPTASFFINFFCFLRFALRFLFQLLMYRSHRLFHTFPFLVLEITEGISQG